jgi:hypothetical protein
MTNFHFDLKKGFKVANENTVSGKTMIEAFFLKNTKLSYYSIS